MDPFIGQVMLFAGNFAPRGWAFCNGQLLSINENQALFSLVGTMYGGDGRTTFGLPDLRGRAAIHFGQGPGLSDRREGTKGGSETNTMTVQQMPAHRHNISATVNPRGFNGAGSETNPGSGFPAAAAESDLYHNDSNVNMGTADVTISETDAGGGQPINNMPPFQVLNYCIALQGIFPSRS